ncbi:threonine--tRNA ligase [bacterium]|nr:threonine--tRNA ligase [Actinomycetota bacterium]MBE32565.1 threonine--tRNA ligase [bacterium]|tara:strand:+ start:7413 stop:9155 length:1743 start_codon:yes stop_codon:yes gene_type:complete
MSQLTYDLDTLRHSTSHVLAQAVLKLFPTAKLGIGPSISDGFYYDFDLDTPITEEDLKKLELMMTQIIDENQSFSHFSLGKEESLKILQKSNQPYKCELIDDLQLNDYSFYENGPFVDLCKGPHIQSTKEIKAFKLLKVSGAYWKGSEKNKMLQRIYGTAFFNPKDLKIYLHQLEEAKKRDHRKIGKELNLFSIQEEIGGGLILWHPKGSIMRNIIETFWKDEHFKQGYDLIYTPHIGKSELWKTSGHLDFYEENMYDKMSIENQDYYLRPMNCPFHIMIYNSSLHSYRNLPIRYAELGTVYRFERSGVLQGLFRVRGFTQDDAHIICSKDQVNDEINRALTFSLNMLKFFGFSDFELFISTKPSEKFVGNPDQWKLAESSLQKAVEVQKLPYQIDEGGGAFYGPKIDIKIKDAIGRQWQCSTIQFDFNLPERFGMSFINSEGNKEEPFMIHRALLGSLERFFGILIEHYSGWFPTWLSPVQCIVLTINSEVLPYAQSVLASLKQLNIRADLDSSSEKIGYKIRQAITQKIPYLIIIGDKEKENNQITLRHKKDNLGSFSLESFMQSYQQEFYSPIDNDT